jgi:transposase
MGLCRALLDLDDHRSARREHSLREVFNGLRYIARSGATWRMMPNDLPPWHTVYQQTQRALAEGRGLRNDVLAALEVGVKCHLLTVAVGYQRRALPVVWQAGEGSRGHTDGDTQVGLLSYTATLLPTEADVIVLGDGEFGHVQLVYWLTRQTDWAYCLRIASDTYIWYDDHWCRLDSFDLHPGQTIWLENVYLTQYAAFGPLNVWLTWDSKHHRLLPVVTNLELPQEVAYWYAKRPGIEPLFGDVKGHGFDLQTCRLRHPERVCRLMLAVALAYVWLCFLGSIALMTGLNKLVDRTDRRDRSLFTIGRLWLNRLLKLDKSILVGFFPYPFLSGIPPAGVG